MSWTLEHFLCGHLLLTKVDQICMPITWVRGRLLVFSCFSPYLVVQSSLSVLFYLFFIHSTTFLHKDIM